jgi:hypothetical protein
LNVGNAGEGKPSLRDLQHAPLGLLRRAETGIRLRLEFGCIVITGSRLYFSMESFPWCTIGATIPTRIRHLNQPVTTADYCR